MRPFRDRAEAGRALAGMLHAFRARSDTLVLALPRGGVPVGYEIARELRIPLDVFVVRKLGVPGHEELALGAIAGGDVMVVDWSIARRMGVTEREVEAIAAREGAELARRERVYREGLPPLDVTGRTVIIADDGLATGSTMRAGLIALRGMDPERIVMAVPVAAAEVCASLGESADEVICGMQPDPMVAVGMWYEDFSQTSDEEVRSLLRRAREDWNSHRIA